MIDTIKYLYESAFFVKDVRKTYTYTLYRYTKVGGYMVLEDLTEIIEIHGQAIIRYCNTILCDYHEAQDAAQTTFVKAYTKHRQYKTGKGLLPWLYKIAYNTCIDILRKKKFIFFFDTKIEGSYQIPDTSMTDELKTALQTLSPKDRALVFNRVIDQMDYKQLAIIYNTSEAALHKRYQRAKEKLAKTILALREVKQ